MLEVLTAAAELVRTGGRAAMATVTATIGSAPQQAGARLLLKEDGELIGTVGGGAVEQDIIEELKRCLETGRTRTFQRDLANDLGMCCGGRMAFFVERVEGKPRLILFGAGHVAEKTAPMAQHAGFRVVVVDDRELLNTNERFPDCTRVVAEPVEAAEELAVSDADWLLILTHDHELDERAFDHYARGPHQYLGLIGSRRKVLRIAARISARGPLPPLEKVYAPVGLALGARSPGEIGASIVAELVALRRGETANHMRFLGQERS